MTKHQITGQKTIRLVWLLMGFGIIFGCLMLMINSYTLMNIQTEVQKQDELQIQLRTNTETLNQLQAEYNDSVLSLLTKTKKTIRDDWFDQFEKNTKSLKQIPDLREYINQSNSELYNTKNLKTLYDKCMRWYEEEKLLSSEMTACRKELGDSLDQLGGVIDKEEGKRLLKQAVEIHRFQQAESGQTPQRALEILSSLDIEKSDRGQDFADIELYCQQLSTSNHEGELADIKDNLLSQTLARLDIGINELEEENDSSFQESQETLHGLFDNFMSCLFGNGSMFDANHQIILGKGGYYNLALDSLKAKYEQSHLESELELTIIAMAQSEKGIVDHAKSHSLEIAQTAQELLSHALYTMTGVCIAGGILFFVIALRIANMIKQQIRTISDSNKQLSKINEDLQVEMEGRIQTEKKLSVAMEKLECASNAKSEFLANMSHEIRTPMNSIMGFAEILQSEELCEEHKEYVNTILASSRCLLQIINDVLDYSKIEAGYLEIEQIECSMKELLLSLDSMLRIKAEEKELAFEVIREENVPEYVVTDSTRISQCLINLTGNAIKFTEKGYVKIRVSVDDGHEKTMLRFDVEDTGIGIKPENIDKVFRKFTQADSSMTRKFGGTGLGLAITQKLSKLLGGHLNVTSENGKGSIFSMLIPLQIPASTAEGQDIESASKEIEEDDAHPLFFSGKILVADDVQANRDLVELLLQRMGFEVTLAVNGQEVVEQALTNDYDLIFMDMQMPVMSGYEAASTLKEKGLQTPIIALTASAMKKEREHCYAMGCDGYLAKPLLREGLNKIIKKYFAPVKQPNIIG